MQPRHRAPPVPLRTPSPIHRRASSSKRSTPYQKYTYEKAEWPSYPVPLPCSPPLALPAAGLEEVQRPWRADRLPALVGPPSAAEVAMRPWRESIQPPASQQPLLSATEGERFMVQVQRFLIDITTMSYVQAEPLALCHNLRMLMDLRGKLDVAVQQLGREAVALHPPRRCTTWQCPLCLLLPMVEGLGQ